MKNKFFILLAIALPLAFTSCGSDDDDDEVKPSTSTSLSKEAKKFVGFWRGSSSKETRRFAFFEDGTGYTDNYNSSKAYPGTWSYNPQTFVLGTSWENDIYEISHISEDSWAGINQSYGRTYTMHRTEDHDAASTLMSHFKWTSKEDTISYLENTRYNNKYEYGFEGSFFKRFRYSGYFLIWFDNAPEEDLDEKDLVVKYNVVTNSAFNVSCAKGLARFENPYNPSKIRLILSGDVEVTLKGEATNYFDITFY